MASYCLAKKPEVCKTMKHEDRGRARGEGSIIIGLASSSVSIELMIKMMFVEKSTFLVAFEGEGSMSLFSESTHAKKWIISPENLSIREQEVVTNTVHSLVTKHSESVRELCLSVEEERLITRHYEKKIGQVCQLFKFPDKIEATAVAFFKRFYLSRSVMVADPRNIMLTCVYLACKVEEVRIPAEQLLREFKKEPSFILDHELSVLEALHFEMTVFNPYRPLNGFLQVLQGAGLSLDMNALRSSAFTHAKASLYHPVFLMYPPGQIALAAIVMALQDAGHNPNEMISHIVTDSSQFAHVMPHVMDIVAHLRLDPGNTDAAVKKADKKLTKLRNSLLPPSTA